MKPAAACRAWAVLPALAGVARLPRLTRLTRLTRLPRLPRRTLLALLMSLGAVSLVGMVQAAGDVARGAAIVAGRSQGLCVLCHALPGQPAAQQGTLGPPLDGVGARLSGEQLRARLLAPERFNPDTVMPSYGRTDGLVQVAPALRGKPLLAPAQIDDVVAYLASLK